MFKDQISGKHISKILFRDRAETQIAPLAATKFIKIFLD
jgi:hypothetical protein